MTVVTNILIVSLFSIFSGLILWYIKRQFDRADERARERDVHNKTESLLILKNVKAIGGLAEKTAICVKNERVNGDMEIALDYYKKQKHDLEDFLDSSCINAMH